MSWKAESMTVVYAALASNLAIALVKFFAAVITSSSAMLSEAVHSLVDTINELLLLYGIKRANRPPDSGHPFGYGRELYLWSFIVTLLVFALGAGVSLYEGVIHLLSPRPIEKVIVNYVVLGVSFLFEAVSWWVALKAFRLGKGKQGYFAAFRDSKDPSTFIVLFEDSAALLGLIIAALGITGSVILDMPRLDGVASIGIGLVLAISSLLLVRETKELLIGEAAHPHVRDTIMRVAADDPGVRNANGVFTIQMGPNQVMAALSAEFHDELDTTQIELCIGRIEAAIRNAHLGVTTVFIKPQTAEVWRRRVEVLKTQAS